MGVRVTPDGRLAVMGTGISNILMRFKDTVIC